MSLRGLIAGLAVVLIAKGLGDTSYAQSIVPDGTTATTVSDVPGNRPIVSIAPAGAGGTSLNRYSAFNVGSAGAALDNRAVSARTIVNEVTGVGASSLAGEIEVLGPGANVIVANPNGISVDGLSFKNANAVVLSSGRVSVESDGRAKLTVTGGAIDISGRGIAGLMQELDLAAKEVRIGAGISGEAAGSSLKVIAGASTVTLGPSPSSAAAWQSSVASGSAANPNAIAVDISGASLTTSGPIRIQVTDQGAGVRLRGDLVSAASDIRIDASGTITANDARIRAKGAVSLEGGAVEIASTTRQSEVQSQTSGVTLRGREQAVSVKGAKISGVERDFSSFASLGGVTIASAAGTLSLEGHGAFKTLISSTKETLAVQAGGGLVAAGVTFEGAADVALSAGEGVALAGSTVTAGGSVRLLSTGAAAISASKLTSQADTRIEAASVAFESNQTARTEVISESGAVFVKAIGGDIVNRGSLVEGFRASLSDPEATSAVTAIASGDVKLTSLSLDALSVFFGRSGDLSVTAEGSIISETGRLFSNADITLVAGDEIATTTVMPGRRVPRIEAVSGKRSWRTLWTKKESIGLFEAVYGAPLIEGEQALVTAIGDVSMSAARIANRGGAISGNAVRLDAEHGISIESLASGAVVFSQRCGLVSCWAEGHSDTGLVAASITAAETLELASRGTVTNTGGRLLGGAGIKVNAHAFAAAEVVLPFTVMRPSGMTGLFSGRYGWISYGYDGGFLSSPNGSIHIATEEPIDLSAAETFAEAGIVIDREGSVRSSRPAPTSMLRPMSLFGGAGL